MKKGKDKYFFIFPLRTLVNICVDANILKSAINICSLAHQFLRLSTNVRYGLSCL
jgi:hypothetical protein